MARRLAHLLVSEGILDQIHLSRDYSIMELKAPNNFVGKSLVQLDVRRKHRVTILAIKRGEEIMVSPGADGIINNGDTLVVIGKNVDLQKLSGL
jgi:trk system potassium uptake protein TrkA